MGVKMIADRFSSSDEGLTDYLAPKESLRSGHPVVSPPGDKPHTVQRHDHEIQPGQEVARI